MSAFSLFLPLPQSVWSLSHRKRDMIKTKQFRTQTEGRNRTLMSFLNQRVAIH